MKHTYFILCLVLLMGCKKTDNTLIKKETIIEKKSGEQYRPAYHFTPEKNWMNDPNGLVYFEGEYHLFYQYYPDDNIWGPMHWGHAISKDMVHWKRLPIALFPDKLGYIFSGSAVIDWNNTTGFGTKEKPAMVAIYTYHDMAGEKSGKIKYQTQAIAYSLDKGRTWVKYEKNPVLENPGIKDFRDPKVFWHQESNKWIMSLAVHDQINFYSSKNLKEWVLESEFGKNIGSHGGIWECPDLFPIKDSYGNTKWVLLVSLNPNGPQGGSATQYFIGDFNGSVFTSDDTKIRWLDYGADNYAGVTFSDIPKDDGRRILIGWMSNWQYSQAVPTYSWRSAMTLPRELLLSKNNNEYYIQSKPIDEIKNILTKSELITSKIHTVKTSSYLIEINKEIQDFKINLQNSTGDIFKIETKNGILITDRTKTGDNSFSEEFGAVHKSMELEKIFNVKIFVDNSSVEIFLNNGELVMTELIFPTNPLTEIYVNEAIKDYKLTPIKPIWKTN